MRTIAHLSDLHFGAVDRAVQSRLLHDLQARPPSLIVVSGDITQRARAGQFLEARRFLDSLPPPRLVLPGNHDIPLYNLVRRFICPLGRFRTLLTENLSPEFQDEEVFVAGVTTARPFTWQSGRISESQIQQLARRLTSVSQRFKVLVTHHPFLPHPVHEGRMDLRNAEAALAVIEQGGVDLLLSGHFHRSYAGDTRAHFISAQCSTLSIQAGTAISRRTRSEPNRYNWITVEDAAITLEVRSWDGKEFRPARLDRYERLATGLRWPTGNLGKGSGRVS